MKNIKQKQIIETGRSLFWRFGIRRVTIEEICLEAKVSKMTFYKYFQNKIDLVKHILDVMTEERMLKYRLIMDQDIPFSEKVNQTIQLKMAHTSDLSQAFYLDIHKNADPELLAYMDQKMQETVHPILMDYIEAQNQGEVRPDIKPEFILYFINQMREMARDESLIDLYETPQALIMELTKFFFYGILPRRGKKG